MPWTVLTSSYCPLHKTPRPCQYTLVQPRGWQAVWQGSVLGKLLCEGACTTVMQAAALLVGWLTRHRVGVVQPC